MNKTQSTKDTLKAVALILMGLFLFLSGLGAVIGYLGLPLLGEDLLGAQLGQMAAIFLGLGGGILAIYHGAGILLNKPSGSMKLPPYYLLWISFALVLAIGNALMVIEVAQTYIFPFLFLLGAALPTVAVVSWTGRRLSWPTSWRQTSLTFVFGATLSVLLVFMLAGIFALAIYTLYPLEDMLYYMGLEAAAGTTGLFERVMLSPAILVFMLVIAFQAPIPEELTKGLAVPFYGRSHIQNERQAFLMGLAAGAGFAILENMLYQGIYAQWSGWTWGGITLLRGFGSVLHPLCTGIVALGWYRSGNGRWMPLFKAYAVAVILHTLWNGGFNPLVYLTGLDQVAYSVGETGVSLYGMSVQIGLILYLVMLTVGLWWLLRRITLQLAEEEAPKLMPVRVSTRAVAVWAFVCALFIVPIGAAIGPAWQDLQTVLFTGF